MKSNLFTVTVILILLVFQPLIADEPGQRSSGSLNPGMMNYGIKLGVNISSMSGSNIGNISAKPGFAFGFFLDYSLMNNLSVQPEIVYSVKGAKETWTYTYEDYDPMTHTFVNVTETDTYTMSISYIEIPVQLNYHFSMPGSPISPHVMLGPAFNIKTGARVKVDYDGETYESDLEDVKTLDVGIRFGGGIRFNNPFGPGSFIKGLNFILHYERGLGNVKDTDYDWDAKNTNISIRMGAVL